MKKELANLLWGLGFAQVSKRRRKQLKWMLIISLLIHAAGLGLFGSWVVMRARTEQRTVFVAPPPIKTYEPRKLEHKVKVQKKQRSSSRPSMVPRLVSMKTSNITLPKIQMDPKIIHTSFQPKFKAVSGKGLGVGLGTGYGLGGFGGGVSAFNFFGIRGRGDRIAILVDVSVSMVEEERGGPSGFIAVKRRIYEVVDALHEAAMFNVTVFADAAKTWQDKLVIANDKNKEQAKRWLGPFNTEGNWGLRSGNVYATNVGIQAVGGTTRLDLALTSAFEQGADTILVISDGLPKVQKAMDPRELAEHERKMAEWRKKNAGKLAAWDKAEVVEKKVWQPARGLKEGQASRKAGWVVQKVRKGRRPGGAPKGPEREFWTFNEFVEHLGKLNEVLYEKKGKKAPMIHSIGYQIDRDGGDFLRKLARHYKGKYRRVARLR